MTEKPLRIGSVTFHFNRISSTNDYAKRLSRCGAREGTVVISDVQTGGRGRLNREWRSPKGGLWLSIILRPGLDPAEVQKMTLLAGVAVAKTIRECYGIDTELKWPNDVLIGGKKVCGILTESSIVGESIGFVVVGVGVNLNNRIPGEIKETATSLRETMGKIVVADEFLSRLLEVVEHLYKKFKKNPGSIIDEWTHLSGTIGKLVEIISGHRKIKGTAVGITKGGALQVKTKNGKTEVVIAGDCRHLR